MSKPEDPSQVLIFDTTLRDGEQSPGISLNTQEKLEIAQQLARLGVDVIEAGFPITSPGDFEAVQTISRTVEGPIITALARTHVADIDAAWNAVKDARGAGRARIHTFISTSDIHIQHQLQTTRDDVKGQARAAVAHAKGYVDDVEFSPMDATRADIEFTAEVCQIAIDEGATTINIPDTVGYTMPHEYAAFPRSQWKSVPGAQKVGRLYVGIEQSLDRGRAIVGRDARRRHPARFDRNGKRGFVNGRVVANHLRDVKLVEASADHRHADQTAGVLAHKVDRGRRRQLSRHHEVAFVLPVLVVEHHHHLAGADVPDGLLDGVEGAVTLG